MLSIYEPFFFVFCVFPPSARMVDFHSVFFKQGENNTSNCRSVNNTYSKFSHIGTAFFPLSWALRPAQAVRSSQKKRAADV